MAGHDARQCASMILIARLLWPNPSQDASALKVIWNV
jgi:hypothetical protein